ncbi:MAG: hypothetical protein KFF72_11705 [Arthrospira sp. SH-MAG29]|nr:hypothetical protein [Arthrospira sp. SH-MAG29]MBS0016997.1 hypothetical protein [Arthrospira sp. SH-MAG29]
MNIPALVNVAIGLFFIYLILSLFVSNLQELIASYLFDWRAQNLKASIQSILGDSMTEKIYDHPLIRSLQDYKIDRFNRAVGPSYIPDDTFALVLISVLMETAGRESKIVALSVDDFQEAIASQSVAKILKPEHIGLMRSLANKAQINCFEKDFIKALETEVMAWFNQSMDRASGVFKRRVKLMILALGFGAAIIMNVDTINIANRLSLEPVIRQQVSQDIQIILSDSDSWQNYINCLSQNSLDKNDCETLVSEDFLKIAQEKLWSLPLGWSSANLAYQFGGEISGLTIIRVIGGWLLTAIAISMGSSFWFDVLNRLIDVRNTGNKPDDT